MKQTFYFLILIGLLGTSCVSNKKIQYLQKDDVNVDIVHYDSALRQYIVEDYIYKIQPQDILSIDFQSLTSDEYDFLNNKVKGTNNVNANTGGALIYGELVDANGFIEYPVLGKVKVSGLTVFEAQDTLQALANNYLKEAVVKIKLLNFRFTIIGEVGREGVVNSYNTRVSLMEAIGLAGGLSDFSDRSAIKILRQSGDKIEVSYVDLLSEDFALSPYYYIHQNDVIVVPPLKQRPYQKYFGKNLALVISSISLLILTLNFINN